MGLLSILKKKKAIAELTPEANVGGNPEPRKDIKQKEPPKFELSENDARNNYFLNQSFFTDSESKFYERLREYLPSELFIILPQVAYTALFDKNRVSHKSNLKIKFNDYKVDFVICDTNLQPLHAIELDGKSHQRKDVAKKDKMKDTFWKALETNASGFKFTRVECKREDNFLFRGENVTVQGFIKILTDLTEAPKCIRCENSTKIKLIKSKGDKLLFVCESGKIHGTQKINPYFNPTKIRVSKST